MPYHGVLQAWIECNGRTAEEYEIRVDNNEISCWIPSEVGKSFSIHCEQHWGYSTNVTDLCGTLEIDGKKLDTVVFRQPGHTTSLRGVQIDSHYIRPFIFSAMNLTDDESLAPLESDRHLDVGTITLSVRQVAMIPGSLAAVTPRIDAPVDDQPIHERSKKVGAHRLGLGMYQSVARTQSVQMIPLSPHPFAVFKFYYRPRDFLQAQGIIPHIHTTVVLELPSGSKRRREQASDDVCREKFRRYDGERVKAEVSEAIAITGMDEINRLEAQQAKIQRRLNRLKKSSANAQIKREMKPVHIGNSSHSWSAVKEVIDLTID